MTDFKDPGNLEMMLDCPMCDFYDLIYYTTQPPIYCSSACKQHAYRQRQGQSQDASQPRLSRRVPAPNRIDPGAAKI